MVDRPRRLGGTEASRPLDATVSNGRREIAVAAPAAPTARGSLPHPQVAVGQFIVDFYCPARRLVVEVDGGVHDGRADVDEERDRILGTLGVRVLRFRNEDVVHEIDVVVRAIAQALER
jgi:hypothetical protein